MEIRIKPQGSDRATQSNFKIMMADFHSMIVILGTIGQNGLKVKLFVGNCGDQTSVE